MRSKRGGRARGECDPIAGIRATPVTVPLEAPLLHSNGAHWALRAHAGRGGDRRRLPGAGEFGGAARPRRGGRGLLAYLKGHDVFRLERCASRSAIHRQPVQQPHPAARGDRVRVPGHHRQKLGVPVSESSAGACATPSTSRATCSSATRTRAPTGRGPHASAAGRARTRAAGAARLPSHKLRAASTRPGTSASATWRWPPRCPASACATTPTARCPGDAIEFGRAIEHLNNDYFRIRSGACPSSPGCASSCGSHGDQHRVVGFEQLAANVAQRAVDVILLDTTFWEHPAVPEGGRVCETFVWAWRCTRRGAGVQLATMLHMGPWFEPRVCGRRALSPLVDDVIVGER